VKKFTYSGKNNPESVIIRPYFRFIGSISC
jgi:hypothetical protein